VGRLGIKVSRIHVEVGSVQEIKTQTPLQHSGFLLLSIKPFIRTSPDVPCRHLTHPSISQKATRPSTTKKLILKYGVHNPIPHHNRNPPLTIQPPQRIPNTQLAHPRNSPPRTHPRTFSLQCPQRTLPRFLRRPPHQPMATCVRNHGKRHTGCVRGLRAED
jgi:hypothetical protein